MMDLFADNKSLFFVVSFGITAIAVIWATWYTLRNILRLWNAGKPTPVELEESEDEGVDSDILQKKSAGISQFSDVDGQDVDRSGGGDFAPQGHVEDEMDPVQYCEHIQSEVKKAKQRVAARQVQETLSKKEIDEERSIQRKQLEDIFKLMQQQNEKFGVDSMDDVKQQMKLYA